MQLQLQDREMKLALDADGLRICQAPEETGAVFVDGSIYVGDVIKEVQRAKGASTPCRGARSHAVAPRARPRRAAAPAHFRAASKEGCMRASL